MNHNGTQLLTYDALTTYGGLALAVIVVTNGLSVAMKLKKTPPWLGLLVSIVICIAVPLAGSHRLSADEVLVDILNSFVIYATALGGNTMAVKTSVRIGYSRSGRTEPFGSLPNILDETPKKTFFHPWL